MLIAISAYLECCPPAASTRGGRLLGMAVDSGGGGANLLRSRYPRPVGPVVAENTAQHQPPPPAGASSFASSDPHAIPNIVNVEEKKKQLQLMAPATINDDVAPPSRHQQEEQKLRMAL